MQRDQKVGLALGVLLLGAVAAFFFRNEPDPSLRVPALESAQAVDREIAEKRLTPYFSENETSDESPRGPRTRPPVPASREVSETRTGERKLPRWDELKSDRDDPFADDTAGRKVVPVPAPDPIRMEAATTAAAASPPADVNQDWNPVGDELTPSAPIELETIHVVQKGETLSSIAGKYLGSQTRFQDVFDANTDQLRDANDLQVGMKLRIPTSKSKPAATSATPQPKRSPPAADKQPEVVPQPKTAGTDETPVNPVSVSTPKEAVTEDIDQTPPVDAAPPEPVKLKFTPAKRRPGRAGAKP